MTASLDHADDCGSAAAYVLGALPGAERRRFEDHLAGCATCRDTVAGLAGMPGLLARVSPDDLTGTGPSSPVPPTLLPRLLREVRRGTRVRRLVGIGVAAAAILAAVLAGLALGAGRGAPGIPPGTAMTRLVSAPIAATVALTPDGHGTRLDMTCRYAGAAYADLPAYDLVVTGRDGHSQDVAQWRVGPDGSTRVVASVDMAADRIGTVEVRTASGLPVLRLAP